MSSASVAWRAIRLDLDVLQTVGGARYRRHGRLFSFVFEPGVRAAYLMRFITLTDNALTRAIARNALVTWFSCDISPGAVLEGGIYLPHPLGIVIGEGVRVGDGVGLYQGVTLGAGRGKYPIVERGATIYPNAIVVGAVTVGANARIGAGVFIDFDVPAGHTVAAVRRREE